jgi:hypothetical protein
MDKKEKIQAIVDASFDLERVVNMCLYQMADDLGEDGVGSVMINIGTSLLAKAMLMMAPAGRALIVEAITTTLVEKIKDGEAEMAAWKAIDKAQGGVMTCYPDKPTKH